jgi:hypothetical protein
MVGFDSQACQRQCGLSVQDKDKLQLLKEERVGTTLSEAV